MTEIVLAEKEWTDNGTLIADVAALGYITGRVLDLTYGGGKFWARFRPDDLTVSEDDFRLTPWPSGEFDTVVFDPPYKLNGTPSLGDFDNRFGIAERTSRRDRMALICAGAIETFRLSKTWALVKCMDQVNGGKVRWQTDIVTQLAWAMEFEKVDSFHVRGGMPQPAGRSQEHASRRFSTLLIFRRQPR